MNGLFVFFVAFLGIAGCALFGPKERAELASHANVLEKCQEEGRMAPDGGHIAAYKACKVDAGVK